MAYTAVPSVLTGDAWSASQHNTYVRDNFAAAWPYTTAGDMSYATSASAIARIASTAGGVFRASATGVPQWLTLTEGDILYRNASILTRLAIGSADTYLSSNGSAPAWSSTGIINAIGYAEYALEYDRTGSTAWADITSMSVTLTTTRTCTIYAWLSGRLGVTNAGGGGAAYGYVRLMITGTEQTSGTEPGTNVSGSTVPVSALWRKTGVTAGAGKIIKAQIMVDDAAEHAIFRGNMFVAAIGE